MLFKKILSFTLAAAVSSSMIAAVPTIPTVNYTSTVFAADGDSPALTTTTIAGSGSFALLQTSYDVKAGSTVYISRCGITTPDSWEISDPSVISVDSTGLVVTGLKAGSAEITYTYNGNTSKAYVTVTEDGAEADSGELTFTDYVVYSSARFVSFQKHGLFMLVDGLKYPGGNPLAEGNTVNVNFSFETFDGVRTITQFGNSSVVTHEQPISLPTPEILSIFDTVIEKDAYSITFKDHGKFFFNKGCSTSRITDPSRLIVGDECGIVFDYRELSDSVDLITYIESLSVTETRICDKCKDPFPRNHLTYTNLGAYVCEDDIDYGWCGTMETAEFTDTVTAVSSDHITFAKQGSYNYTKLPADDAAKLKNLTAGDKVSVSLIWHSTYDTFIDELTSFSTGTSSVSTTTYVVTEYPITTTTTSFTGPICDTTPITTTATTTSTAICDTSTSTATTTSDPTEVWMWMTGVDHFDSIRTLPTKTIYTEGEELDLSGLVINAYHQADKFSNKGNSMTVRTDYVWEIEKIDPKFITIEGMTGEVKGTNGDISKLNGGEAYTVVIDGGNTINLNVKGDQYEKEMYDTNEFRFRIYISPKDGKSKFIPIKNGEVEAFSYGFDTHGFVIKGYGAFSIDMDAHMHMGYNMPAPLQKGDVVSGVLYINPNTNYIYTGDLEVSHPTLGNGDSNCDNKIELADAILVMQALANPDKYDIGGSYVRCMTETGRKNADVNGGGMTTDDALDIQLHLLGKKTLAMR